MIVVCVKQVPDTDDVAKNPETGSILRHSAGSIPNPADARAISAALSAGKALSVPVMAITMGPKVARASLRQALALGCEQAVHLNDSDLAGADSLITAKSLASIITYYGQAKLVFCGQRSADGDTGQVAGQLSTFLGYRFVPNLRQMIDVEPTFWTVKQRLDNRIQTIQVEFPCVCSVEATAFKMEYPTYRQRMDAKRKPIEMMTAEQLGLTEKGYSASPTKLKGMFEVKSQRAGQQLDLDFEGQVAWLTKLLEEEN